MFFNEDLLVASVERKEYSGIDIAVIVPTKDRPEKIRNLLESLAGQSEQCSRIIIIDGGESVAAVVASFADRLQVEHHVCQPPGQIRQRNMGISLLDVSTPLVAFVDDDIVFEETAFAEMVAFWNSCREQPAGVSFNIVNSPPFVSKPIRRFFFIDANEQGRVLKSGYPITVHNVSKDLHTQWVPGGATVWQQEIIRKYQHREIYAKRALFEDLIFSYPIGKDHLLYVAHKSRVRHEHVFDHTAPSKAQWYYGRTFMLWMLYFVSQHRELSVPAYLWMAFGMIAGDLLQGLFRINRGRLQKAAGEFAGIMIGLTHLLFKGDLVGALSEKLEGS